MVTMKAAVRRLAASAACMMLAGCQLFAPGYDPQIGEATSAAYVEAAQLLSEAELGRFAEAESFAAEVPRYARIDAELETAALRAGSLPASGGGARRARELLAEQIEGCRSRIRSLAGIHEKSGIAPDAGLTANARVSCDLAARAAVAMRD